MAMNDSYTCPNCAFVASERYCARCGQSRNAHVPTFRGFLMEYLQQFVAAEGRLGTSLRLLFTRPGQLTLDYLQGRRARHVRPLNLFLSFNFLLFSVLLVLTPQLKSEVFSAEAGFRDGLMQGAGGQTKRSVIDGNSALFPHIASTALFAATPLFALWLHVAQRQRRQRYGVALVSVLHFQSFALGLVCLLLPLILLHDWLHDAAGGWWAFVAFLGGTLLYFARSLRCVYGDSWWLAIAKSVAVLGWHALIVLSLSIGWLWLEVAG